jgi:hypothetical protein
MKYYLHTYPNMIIFLQDFFVSLIVLSLPISQSFFSTYPVFYSCSVFLTHLPHFF